MTIILSVTGVLLSVIVIVSALLFGREWFRTLRESMFAREVRRHSGLAARLREGSPDKFPEALEILRG